MSTDFNVIDDESREYCHLGQRMAMKYSFGYGSKDENAHAFIAEWICSRLNYGKMLRICLTDDIPSGYTKSEDGIDLSQDDRDDLFQ